MDVRSPTWALRSELCIYCEVGDLAFSVCPSCGVVIVICGECGTAYEIHDRHRGKEVGDTSGSTRCYSCGRPYQHEFPPATAENIRDLGFTQDEYR